MPPPTATPVVVTGEVLDDELEERDAASRYRGGRAVGTVRKEWAPEEEA
eukprot:COSAG03_NODE_17141_length_383_cov_0.785211_1_plen_48_part_10